MPPDQQEVESIPTRPTYVFVLPWDLDQTGGVNQVVTNLHREMSLAGELEPLIMVTRWSAFRPIETTIDGRRTVHLRLWSPWKQGGGVVGLVKWVLSSPVWIFDMLRFCRVHRVMTFNFHYAVLSAFPIAVLRFLRLYRGDLVISFHGSDFRSARDAGRIEQALWKFVLRSATAIVACSKGLAADVRQFAGEAGGNVHAVQNGLDKDLFLNNVDRSSGGLPAVLLNREFILSVATWEWNKGLDILVRAFAEVKGTNDGLALVLVGRAGNAESDLRALAQELGVANDVLFFENVPHGQVGLYLERAKVFCLPSRAEGFGIAILEAGAYRLPVVASRVGGIPEIVIDGETGLLTEPGDADAVAVALRQILSNDELARDLGERLYQRVVNEFSWKRAYREYRQLVL